MSFICTIIKQSNLRKLRLRSKYIWFEIHSYEATFPFESKKIDAWIFFNVYLSYNIHLLFVSSRIPLYIYCKNHSKNRTNMLGKRSNVLQQKRTFFKFLFLDDFFHLLFSCKFFVTRQNSNIKCTTLC